MPDHVDELLAPYVPRLVISWLRDQPQDTWAEVQGSLAFVDISGFTALTERLARRGKVGAEEMSDLLNSMFADLLAVAYRDGAGLVKWGGDAVLLLFEGENHAARAVRAACRMRATLRRVGKLRTPAGLVTLRMSVGVHSGDFHFFLVGDPGIHRELIISGPAASRTAELEALADAGEIAVSAETSLLLPPGTVGAPKGNGYLVAREPSLTDLPPPLRPALDGLDIGNTLPPPIRRHLLAGTGSAEHRRIAVAFVQFSGTDDVLVSGGPAALADALDECVRNVQEATARHGVTFFESDINRDGGKIMLTAGAPASSDHDEEAMLRTARLIIDRIGTLPLRIGVNCGPVFSGDFGPAFRRTYSVKGDAINLAARVMGKALPGQVLATQATINRAISSFDVDPLAPFMVKGKSEPVHAVSLGRLQGTRVGPETAPLVGREHELSVLRRELELARAGGDRLVDLVGEPGIGKSRLVEELVRDLDLPVHTFRCDEYEAANAYWPIRTFLVDQLELDESASAHAVGEALARRAPHLRPWLPLIGVVLDVQLSETVETAAVAEQFRKARTDEVTAEFIETVVGAGAVLIFDDVHLMDDASADVLDVLCRRRETRGWLTLLTRRDRATGFTPDEAYGATQVRPAPLTDQAMAALVQQELAEHPLPPDQVAALAQRAGGNPLFLRGLVLAVRTGADPNALPDSVEALITSQIDRLAPAERTVLRFASVLGVEFPEVELRALLQGHELPTSKESLANLAYFLRAEGHGTFKFAHQLIRDAAYEGLPYRLRRDLHGRAGAIIEASAQDPADMAELLSLHYFHAARPEQAWTYSRLAGLRAAEKFAHAQADELLTRAVTVARSVAGLSADELFEVHRTLAESRMRTGRNDPALAAFRSARKLAASEASTTGLLLLSEAEIQLRQGRTPVALRTLRRGMSGLAARTGSAELSALSRLEGMYAVVREKQAKYRDALTWARSAQAHADRSGDRAALADALEAVHGVMSMLGLDQDRDYGSEALALYEQIGDRVGQSRALNNLAVLAWIRGRGEESLEMFRRAEKVATAAGDSVGAASTKYNIGDVLVRMGRSSEAAPILREAIPTLRALGVADFAAAAARGLALADALAGEFDKGLAELDEVRLIFEQLREDAEVVETDAARALALLLAGQASAAEDLARRAAERARELDAGYLLPWLLRLYGAALSDLGQLDRAEQVLLEALELAETQSRIDRGFVLAELETVALRTGKADLAVDFHQLARSAFAELGFSGSPRYEYGA